MRCPLLLVAVFMMCQLRAQVVINEILFNPKPSGFDYVELYNRGDSAVDLHTLFLTNKTAPYGPLKKLSDTPRLLLPHTYVVLTEDAQNLSLQYLVKDADAVQQVADLPAFANAGGTVVLVDSLKNLVDVVTYSEDWQENFLAGVEGVALERIDPAGPSSDKSNWRSAATDAGYGTPGYQNSQFKLFQNPIIAITVAPAIFSPDGDGVDDVATLSYRVTDAGYVANVFVYDGSGRQVRHLVKNALLGSSGSFIWDGRDEQGRPLLQGQYILLSELFTTHGKKQQFKAVLVLARR